MDILMKKIIPPSKIKIEVLAFSDHTYIQTCTYTYIHIYNR